MIADEGATPNTGTESTDPLIGRTLAERYHVQELVARGGMGRIYRAEQRPLGRTVAVKVLHIAHETEDDGRFRERFFREASTCSRLRHPNTVRIFDYGNEGETFFIVMEFLEGRALSKAIRAEGPLPIPRVLALARQVCRSLTEAHDQGVIHRDLKPGNIFLCRHGAEEFVKVLDFGLVKSMGNPSVTQADKILGSPMYMAPEQVMGREISQRTDVYSLGMVLYAMLTKTLPFKREHPMAVLNAQVNARLPSFASIAPTVEVPDNVEWVVRTCLAKRPEDRFASMVELERALGLCQASDTVDLNLDRGRVQMPPGFEEPLNLDPSAPVAAPPIPEDSPSLPERDSLTGTTLAERPRPIRIAMVAFIALLMLAGAAGALGVGWFLGSLERSTPAQPIDPVAAEPELPLEAEDPVEASEVEEPSEEAPLEEQPEAEAVPRPTVVPKPRTPQPILRPNTVTKSPSVEPVETPEVEEPIETPPEEPEKDAPAEEEPEDWTKPKSDLRNPWEE